MPRYVPEAGNIVRLNFNPQAGHEQAGTSATSAPSAGKQQDQSGALNFSIA